MVKAYAKQILLLIKRLLLCYLFYFISRLLFIAANYANVGKPGLLAIVADCFYGLRFDSFSIVIANSLFILLSLIPFGFVYRKWFQNLLLWAFAIPNSIFLATNYVDVGYFPFIKKRSTAELFNQLGGQTDMGKLLPQFARDFWWLLLLFILSVYILIILYKKIKLPESTSSPSGGFKQWTTVIFIFLLSVAFAVLGARGGLQRVPIDVVNAGATTSTEQIPVVLNTPFTIIKSWGSHALEEYPFYDETTLHTIYSPIHHYKDSVFKPLNVVVLILESFAKEYTKLGHIRSLTPFLDSLMDKSLTFTNGFSNGTKSIEGIPAILSSMPSLMQNPVINSVYATNYQTSLAGLLKERGYTTAFFHGGINGTMNFTDWAPSAGYENYFGRSEYNNDKDFDGFWGIFDEPFLQYSVTKMSSFQQPFHSAIFTLSSHHPYLIPEKYKNRFPKTKIENSESLGYADYALRRFFDAAKTTSWYNNTLFILTADHTSLTEHPFYSNAVGYFAIPILFFKPDNSLSGQNNHVFSQIDILPSTMSLIGYNRPFFAFGQSYNDKTPRYTFSYINGEHYMYGDSIVYRFSDANLHQVYNFKRDSVLDKNLIGLNPQADSMATKQFRAFLQTYNSALIHNTCRVK